MDRSSVPLVAESEGSSQGLHALGMLELLKYDPRPTFILDGAKTMTRRNTSHPIAYWNPALARVNNGELLTSIKGDNATVIAEEQRPVRSEFQTWITTQEVADESCTYLGYKWTKLAIVSQWIVVFGAPTGNSTLTEKAKSKETISTKNISQSKDATYDWTEELAPKKISPYVSWARSIDWSQTPLGAMSKWSPQLRSIANLVMQDPQPAVIFYGSGLTMIYNEAYVKFLGSLHPCMGFSARTVLTTVWSEYFEPIVVQNCNGETVELTEFAIHTVRDGIMLEAYFSTRFIPILDSDGAIVGHYEPLIETTKEVVSRRQSQTLLQLSEEVLQARDINSYWALATEVLSRNDKDVPFALLYSVEYSSSNSHHSAEKNPGGHQQYLLQGSVGLPEGSSARPAHLDFREDWGFMPYVRQAIATREPTTVSFEEDPAFAKLFRDVTSRGFGDPCRGAVICPLNPTSSNDNIHGFMVVGLNPRRPYDDDYRHFVSIVSRMLSTSLISLRLHDEDIRRKEKAIADAEIMRLDLKRQLLSTQEEVERSLYKFQRFAEGADIGIFILGLNGVFSYRNEAWYSILGTDRRNDKVGLAWDTLIDDEYVLVSQTMFQALIETKQHQSFELRLKRTTKQILGDSEPRHEPAWVLCSIFPDMQSDGEMKAMIGCFTDISQQKLGEKVQAIHALNAEESRRQLESFIDTTSHEIRNPLSAIIQCADSIISTHKAFGGSINHPQIYQNILDTAIDAAETIVQCSKHMKTIVDDVLTMSKLDSGLFVMTPVDVQLEFVAKAAVKMFEGEARLAGVELELCLEDSCKETNIKSISLDPTRVLQILINLLTNAIKFTHLEKKRRITVSLGISCKRPLKYVPGHVEFIRTPKTLEAPSLQADWGKGENVYIVFAVRDTGRGLSDSERDLLFARFSQASPRTHIDYGGSGLGLFISKRLTEMHGGAIGFASKAGIGSTFAFYVRSRRSDPGVDLTTGLRSQLCIGKDKPRSSYIDAPGTEFADVDLHILIVEDNLVNQRVLAKQLRNIGMHVAVANHGGEALEYLRSTNYCVADGSGNSLSLILMDWEMPVMDGLTCVANIRQLQEEGIVNGHVPVIAVTANVRSEQVATALQAGMDDIISKPFRIPDLRVCIQRTLRNTAPA